MYDIFFRGIFVASVAFSYGISAYICTLVQKPYSMTVTCRICGSASETYCWNSINLKR